MYTKYSKENIIEFEGIEFKCFSLIEYTSLIELLKLLAKKYKNLEEKMNILDGRMIEKDKRILGPMPSTSLLCTKSTK